MLSMEEFYFSKLFPVVIAAHCKEPYLEDKLTHLNNLIQKFSKDKFFTLLIANSKIPREIIDKANFYLEDSMNYTQPHYGVSVSMQTELSFNILKYHNFKWCLRLEYDAPLVNYEELLAKQFNLIDSISKEKLFPIYLLGSQWGPQGINTGNMLCDINFILDNTYFFNFINGHKKYGHTILEKHFKDCLAVKDKLKHCLVFDAGYKFYNLAPDSPIKDQKYQAGGNIKQY